MESLRGTFDAVAATYQDARPDYPTELYDDLVTDAGLGPGARLLEVGCATGKATRPLLDRGFLVVCVELGERLAEQARRDLAGMPVTIHVSPFETWQAEGRGFDLVYAATAWNWIAPDVRYSKAHALLRPGGHLAIWDATHAFPVGFDPFFAEIQETYNAIGERHVGEWPPPPPDQVADRRDEILATGLFADVHVRRYLWSVRYTADEYIALLDTFSGHIAMEATKRDRLYTEIRQQISRRDDKRVVRHWLAILHVAARR
jgi:SAM-dependent methyltransferase